MNVPHDDPSYLVVRNAEEQYSIWPEGRELPTGWQPDADGFSGTKDDCLAHIDKVWTDMRPLSLRTALAEAELHPAPEPVVQWQPGPDLVTRLTARTQPVRLVLRPRPSIDRLRGALAERYVHVLFPDTAGGTELGIALTDETDVSTADLTEGSGTVRVIGELTLDFHRMRCEVEVDLADFTGQGRLHHV